ncbi:MAG: tRNA uridine-5-carboxymethylaminomethyl(34) synthesis GTPase MnmE [Rhodospirillaceae bacterium]|nr:tRNA uridine-5-carboxymethylaminomethyl(34) synthesis GTPase MnmE [Rhodospirillaceae bacterium]
METIYALASGSGVAGIAVVRVSGPVSYKILSALTGHNKHKPRYAVRSIFRNFDGDKLDDGLSIWFPAPASFTGEDVVELHIHGGVACISAIFDMLRNFDGVRLAYPGEFTRRAFDNGKLDLTEVEALSDLISAETDLQRKQALRLLEGSFGSVCDELREELLKISARIEAWIDFPDEELPPNLFCETRQNIEKCYTELEQYLDRNNSGERVREGLTVSILGAPNVGKSSLLNLLAGRQAAIVSEQAGTTRDIIEVRCDIGGLPVTFADSAGLRETADAIEEEGVRRAIALSEKSDLCIFLEAQDCQQIDREKTISLSGKPRGDFLFIQNKIDQDKIQKNIDVAISLKTGENMDIFFEALESWVKKLIPNSASVILTRERHREALEQCSKALKRAAVVSEIELVAEDLRQSANALGRINGRFDVEDILDRIFGEFCIGK